MTHLKLKRSITVTPGKGKMKDSEKPREIFERNANVSGIRMLSHPPKLFIDNAIVSLIIN